MSCRQPEAPNTATLSSNNVREWTRALMRHLPNANRTQALQKLSGFLETEARIGGLDSQKKSILSDARELSNVEHRMVGQRQSIQSQHSDHSGKRREQNGQLKTRNHE